MSLPFCNRCQERFGRVRTFDAHRIGVGETRRCLSTTEMYAMGWSKGATGRWHMPIKLRVKPGPAAQPDPGCRQ